MRRTSNVEAAAGGAKPQHLSAKAGNTIAQSNALFETYTPVQLAAVRQAEEARKKGWEKSKKKNGRATKTGKSMPRNVGTRPPRAERASTKLLRIFREVDGASDGT
jgi:hypothetical protein